MVEGAEEGSGPGVAGMGGGEGGERLFTPLASNVCLAAGLITVLVAGAGLFWSGTWLIYDFRVSFEDTVATALVETSRGLFIGAGLLGVLGALRSLGGIGRLLLNSRHRR